MKYESIIMQKTHTCLWRAVDYALREYSSSMLMTFIDFGLVWTFMSFSIFMHFFFFRTLLMIKRVLRYQSSPTGLEQEASISKFIPIKNDVAIDINTWNFHKTEIEKRTKWDPKMYVKSKGCDSWRVDEYKIAHAIHSSHSHNHPLNWIENKYC